MFLVELVVQGVRGIRELARIRFQRGFNVVAAGNESGKTSSTDAMVRLLFPSSQPGLMEGLISRYTPDASRAALVAYADDGAYYRVIEDFSKRAVNVSKYNAATKEFALTYKDWENAVQFMSGITGGISEDEYARLFVFRRDHYAGTMNSTPRTAAARHAASAPVHLRDTSRTAEQEARLAELREALRRAEEAADADYRAQSAKMKLQEITKKQEMVEEIDGRSAEMKANLEAFAGCESLPENLNELLDEHEQRQGEKMAKCDELTREIEDMRLQLDAMPQMRLATDKLFILGALIAVLSLVAGLFVLTAEQSEYFPLGLLLALALMSIAWYKGSSKKTARKAVAKEIEHLEAELQEIEKSFEQGGSQIEACMKGTGSNTIAELKEKADNYRYFLGLAKETEEQRTRMLGEIGPEGLQAEYEKQQKEVSRLEKEASALSQYAVDTMSLRQDIERLEQEMAGGSPAGFGGSGQEFSNDLMFEAPAAPASGNGLNAELEIASRTGAIEMETLVPAVEAAAQRNLAAITGGRYVRIEAGQERGPVLHAKDDSLVSFSDLSHGTRELVYFCLRTGLIEAIAGKLRLPLILDDPLAGFDPGRQQAACQILRSLGAKTQVILLTSNPSLKSAGDAAAELK